MKRILLILIFTAGCFASGCAGGRNDADRQNPMVPDDNKEEVDNSKEDDAHAKKKLQLVVKNPQQSFPETIKAGNYSGISHIGGNQYAVVNDKSPNAGFYIFNIDIDLKTGLVKKAEMSELRHCGQGNMDEEGVAFYAPGNTVFTAREKTSEIVEYRMDGSLTGRKLEIPQIYKKNIKFNLGFEALAYNDKTHRFWTCNEGPLKCDGLHSKWNKPVRNRLRLQSFGDDMKPRQMYAYETDAVTARSDARLSQVGVSSIIAMDDGRLLILEREIYIAKEEPGSFMNEKIYITDPTEGKAISADEKLRRNSPYLKKELLCEWKTSVGLLSYDMANYEAMCPGPVLENGDKTIILICDSQNQLHGLVKDWFKVIVVRDK